MKSEVKKLPNSEVEINLEIPSDDFMSYWQPTVAEFAKNTTVDGFRPGKAPEKMVIDKVGEDKILIEMAERALKANYVKAVTDNKLDIIGAPEVSITKIAKDNPLGLKIKVAIMPEVNLPDYKKIAKEVAKEHPTEEGVTEEEVNKVVDEIRKNKAMQDGKKLEEKDGKPILPELTDDFVKTLGDFKSVDDFKNKIKDNIKEEKKHRSVEKRRLAIIEKIGEEANPNIPPVLIENEIEKMLNEMRGQIEQMGMKFEDYLTHIKKSVDDLKKDWQEDAKKRVRFGLLIHAISEKENIKPEEEEIKKQADILKQQMPDQNIDENRIKAYVGNVLTNEKVMTFLDPEAK